MVICLMIQIMNIKCNKLKYNIQNLYFGAPGTGKSYGIDNLIIDCYPEIEIKTESICV